MNTERFLHALWGKQPPGPLLIWSLPHKISRYSTDPRRALAQVRNSLDHHSQVYTAVGLPAPNYSQRWKSRPKSHEIHWLAGLWADVDSANGPADFNRLSATLEPFPDATIWVDTGGGWHGWWLFDEPWELDSDLKRRQAQELARAFQQEIRDLWQPHHWKLDATHDLSRVMRAPGTLNRKYDPPRPVTVTSCDGPRRPPQFWIKRYPGPTAVNSRIPSSASRPNAEPPFGNSLIISADRQVNPECLRLALARSPKFCATWQRRRSDLADASASGYDFSLAIQALRQGWNPQAVADLLISHRRIHGDDLKLRPSYYVRTINRASQLLTGIPG